MTEEEWQTATDPRKMASGLKDIVSDRKLRLFGVACCRRVLHLVLPESRRAGVELAERYVDGCATRNEVDRFVAATRTNYSLPSASIEANAAVVQPCLVRDSFDGSSAAYFSASYAAVAMAHYRNSLKTRPDEFLGPELVQEEEVEQMRLARHIFGNPFRSVIFDPSWRTSAAVALARTMYDSRDFTLAPVLADALEDAGCDDAQVLEHLRGSGPHVRGCFVVDAVLGLE